MKPDVAPGALTPRAHVASLPFGPTLHGRHLPRWVQRVAGLSRPRLVDACLLFNEIDLLEIRMAELDPVVDTFVVVEADRTFAGRQKPFFFDRYRERFRRWERKIVYERVRLPSGPVTMDESDRFLAERTQRDHLGRAVAALPLEPHDVAVLGDVDEIWRARSAGAIVGAAQRRELCVLVLRNFRGYVNNVSKGALNGIAWAGPAACRLDQLARLGANGVRESGGKEDTTAGRNRRWKYLTGAGWHFSSFGGPEACWIKAQNFSHVADPHRVIGLPPDEREVRVITGPMSREECAARQAVWLAHAEASAFSPMAWSSFAVPADLPASLKAGKERFRHFFFFTQLDGQPNPGGSSPIVAPSAGIRRETSPERL